MTTSQTDYAAALPRLAAIFARGLEGGAAVAPEGQVCIEQAIALAMGETFSDAPSCVEAAVRVYSIALNDASWSSPQARAAGLHALAIAQIGSVGVVDPQAFLARLAEKHIAILLPRLFRALFPSQPACLQAADLCESQPTRESARVAGVAAAEAAAEAVAEASEWASEWAAARAAARASEWAAGVAAARASEWASEWAAAEAAAEVAEAAAEATAEVAARAAWDEPDAYLLLSATLAVETLCELGSPGCALLPA